MKKIVLITLLLLLSGWKFATHIYLIDSVYYSLPLNIRETLNLTSMEEGAIAPDKIFRDVVLHHYPKSYDKAVSWLGIAVDSYKRRDYENASYAFGVASHYIGDSFVAPHYITKEDYKLHDLFESQAITALKSKCKKESYDLNRSLHLGSLNGKDWELWLKSKNKEIPINEAEQSLQLLYFVALDSFNTSCSTNYTLFEEMYFIPDSALIFLFIVVGILLVYLILKKI